MSACVDGGSRPVPIIVGLLQVKFDRLIHNERAAPPPSSTRDHARRTAAAPALRRLSCAPQCELPGARSRCAVRMFLNNMAATREGTDHELRTFGSNSRGNAQRPG